MLATWAILSAAAAAQPWHEGGALLLATTSKVVYLAPQRLQLQRLRPF
jgi:hypothetical protein